MKFAARLLLVFVLAVLAASPIPPDALERGFRDPPRQAKLRAYWWWLNGNVTKPSITRDLEEMAAKGFGGALICDAGGAEQDGNDRVPHGPDFLSSGWRELYRHALREADRLGLEMSVNIQSGWNLGGPMVRAEDAPKKLVWSETVYEHRTGKGRVIFGRTARDVLAADGIRPDFETSGGDEATALDYIHRRDGATDTYFVANRSNRFETVRCTFRVAGKQPELWDPVTGLTRRATSWSGNDRSTTVPLDLDPYGSIFVVFRQPATEPASPEASPNFPRPTRWHEIAGPWTVKFDPAWGGSGEVLFPALVSWTARPEPGIRFYSGTAAYSATFDLPEAPPPRAWLDLGELKQLAEVRLNGRSLGVLWTYPFRAEISGLLRPAGNRLEIDVVNFWPNRVIGDQSLPPFQRLTRTNIRKLTADTPLVESGLFGPVAILTGPSPAAK